MWNQNPSVKLVFSSASVYQNREDSRYAELMLGVTESAMTIEPNSRNTRGHPVEALNVPLVDMSILEPEFCYLEFVYVSCTERLQSSFQVCLTLSIVKNREIHMKGRFHSECRLT